MAVNDGKTIWCDIRLVLGKTGAEAYVLEYGTEGDDPEDPAAAPEDPGKEGPLAPLPWAE
jgi:hypothetical protein